MEASDDLRQRLKAFCDKVEVAHHRTKWKQIDDLRGQVTHALHDHIDADEGTETERPGWYRGPSGFTPAVAEEIARLSAENARLQATLKEFETSKAPDVRLVLGYEDGETFVPFDREACLADFAHGNGFTVLMAVHNQGSDDTSGANLQLSIFGPTAADYTLAGRHSSFDAYGTSFNETLGLPMLAAGQTIDWLQLWLEVPQRDVELRWLGTTREGVGVRGSCKLVWNRNKEQDDLDPLD